MLAESLTAESFFKEGLFNDSAVNDSAFPYLKLAGSTRVPTFWFRLRRVRIGQITAAPPDSTVKNCAIVRQPVVSPVATRLRNFRAAQPWLPMFRTGGQQFHSRPAYLLPPPLAHSVDFIHNRFSNRLAMRWLCSNAQTAEKVAEIELTPA